ncbi:MAG: hypothetical protein RLZZ435_1054 [Cyanobacteriota bacterium]|jgi:hypothetical protein
MGEIDRTAASESLQYSLQQLEDTLDQENLETDPVGTSAASPGQAPKAVGSYHREQQLAAMEAAIADLEAFLGSSQTRD